MQESLKGSSRRERRQASKALVQESTASFLFAHHTLASGSICATAALDCFCAPLDHPAPPLDPLHTVPRRPHLLISTTNLGLDDTTLSLDELRGGPAMLRVRRQDQEHVLAVPVGRRKQLLMLPGLPTTCASLSLSDCRPYEPPKLTSKLSRAQVWPVHRLVCGPGRAKPFQWPLLTQAEADEAIEHVHDSTGKLASIGWQRTTAAKAMRQCAGILEDRAEVRRRLSLLPLPQLDAGLTLTEPLSHATVRHPLRHGRRDLLPAEDQQRVVLVVRAHEHLRLTGIRSPLRPRPTTPSTVLNELANHDFNIARDEPFWSPDRDEPWRNDYRHQTLVLLALVSKGREHLPGAPSGQITIYIRSNYERAADFIRTTIAPSKPEVAAHLLDQYTPILELAAAGRAQAAALGRPV
mgnify:CR=1 FL=1